MFGLDDPEPIVLNAGQSFYEPPGALHSVSRMRFVTERLDPEAA